MEAAASVDADAAFIAWVAEHNAPFRRVAERLGLVDRGLRIDASDGIPRLAYADREIDDELMPPLRAAEPAAARRLLGRPRAAHGAA
jgi:hypothetical protein